MKRARRISQLACRVCGCTEDRACAGGCWWVPVEKGSKPLCSTCAGTQGDVLEAVKRTGKLSRAAKASARGLAQAALTRAAVGGALRHVARAVMKAGKR